MKKALKIIALFLATVFVFAISSCSKEEKKPENSGEIIEGATNFVVIEVEDYGKIKLELYPDIAPKTVLNFKKLVKNGFYDGLTFHRIMKGFMIQGGDPKGDGTGSSGERIYGEFAENGFNNTLKHERGVVSMARAKMPNSASCQFFIVHQTSEDNTYSLDGKYAAFGKVIEGIETVDKIASVKTNPSNDRPLEDVIMKKVYFVEK